MKDKESEKLIVKKVPGIPYIRVVEGTGISNEFPKHVHMQLCIGIVVSGGRIINFAEKTVPYKKNDIFIINPGEPHSCTALPGDAHSYMVLTVDPSVNGVSGLKFREIVNKRDGLYLKFIKLVQTIDGESSLLEKESEFYSFLDTLSSVCGAEKIPSRISAAHRTVIRKTQEHLEQNLTEKISIDDLAGIAGLSQFHFNRIFCSITGLSPYAYHLHARVEHAKHMLLGGKSIVDTALDSGFTDQSHFSRYFKKIVGVTPGVFIKYNR